MPDNNTSNRTTFWMALIAIIISLVGTVVSIMEANILRAQQELMLEEKAAAVWPHLAVSMNVEFSAETLSIKYAVINKGVGPALLGGFQFSINDGEPGELLDAIDVLRRKYPELRITPAFSSVNLNSVVVPGESKAIYHLQITSTTGVSLLSFVSLSEELTAQFCYCSIYGDCWDAENNPLTKEEACAGRELLKKAG